MQQKGERQKAMTVLSKYKQELERLHSARLRQSEEEERDDGDGGNAVLRPCLRSQCSFLRTRQCISGRVPARNSHLSEPLSWKPPKCKMVQP